jgi:hypothetical protein
VLLLWEYLSQQAIEFEAGVRWIICTAREHEERPA